jgi:uroporphyrinogen-III synthase
MTQLRGFRIGVTSDRRADDLIAALERRGAQVLHAPALTIAPNEQDGSLVLDTREVIVTRPEVVLITTGYGMRRWFEVADAAGLGSELTAVLEDARIFARGPKAHGAVRAAGLLDAQSSELDTTASLVDAVIAAGLTGRQVAVQLHGFTDEAQLARLREVSGRVLTVTPYRWARPHARERLPRLINAACRHQLDAVTFTSAPAAAALLETADGLGLRAHLVRAMADHVTAVAVGPVTAMPLKEAGITPVVPDRFRLGALIRLVSEELVERHVRRFRCGQTEIELRGSSVSVDGRHVMLGPNALLLFTALASSEVVVSRQQLIDRLPDDLDDHALEVAMSRLRRALGVPGLITTVVKRGYRLNASRVA